MGAPDGRPDGRPAGHPEAPAWLVGLVVLGATAWAILPVGTGVMLHQDTSRDRMLAAGCLESPCRLEGPRTSLGGLHQGGLWVVQLASFRALGLPDVETADRGARGLFASAVLLLLLTGRAVGGWTAGLLAAGLLVALVGPGVSFRVAWNPAWLALPSTGLVATLLLSAASRRGAWLVAAAACLAWMVHLHWVALLALPGAVVLAVVFRPRRAVAWSLAAAGVFAASVVSLAGDALPGFLQVLDGTGQEGTTAPGPESPLPWALVPGLAAAAVLVALRPWREDRRRAAPVAAGVLLGAVPILALAAGAAAGRHGIQDYYLAPFVPGLALAAGWAAAILLRAAARLAPGRANGRWRACLPASAAAAFLTGTLAVEAREARRFDDEPVTYEALGSLARALRERGPCGTSGVAARLEGSLAVEALVALQADLPPEGPCPGAGSRLLLARTFIEPAGRPAGLPAGDLLATEHDTMLDWSRAVLEASGPGGARKSAPGEALAVGGSPGHPEPAVVSGGGVDRVGLRVPFRLPDGRPRTLAPCLDAQAGASLARVRIDGGVSWSALDDGRIRLPGGQAGGEGELVVDWQVPCGGSGFCRAWPSVIEVPAGDPALERLAEEQEWWVECRPRP